MRLFVQISHYRPYPQAEHYNFAWPIIQINKNPKPYLINQIHWLLTGGAKSE